MFESGHKRCNQQDIEAETESDASSEQPPMVRRTVEKAPTAIVTKTQRKKTHPPASNNRISCTVMQKGKERKMGYVMWASRGNSLESVHEDLVMLMKHFLVLPPNWPEQNKTDEEDNDLYVWHSASGTPTSLPERLDELAEAAFCG